MLLRDLLKSLNSIYPTVLSEKWDIQSSLQVGDPSATITKALVALDVRDAVIDEAKQIGANLIITHHPLIFKPLSNLISTDPISNKVIKLIKNDIALISLHTNADSVIGGLNDYLAFLIGLIDLVPLIPSNTSVNLSPQPVIGISHNTSLSIPLKDGFTCPFSDNSLQLLVFDKEKWSEIEVKEVSLNGLGRVGKLAKPVALSSLIDSLTLVFRSKLGNKYIPKIKSTAQYDRLISTVAICTGSGSSLISSLPNVDCFITGDVTYHTIQAALDRDLVLVDASHWATEVLYEEVFVERIGSLCPRIQVVQSNFSGDLFE
ncbi:hypothetical protein RCL1_004300 [Eukaryota sp. TZLM3-RCL]